MAKAKSVLIIAPVLTLLLSLLNLAIIGTAVATTDEVKWSKVNIPTEGKPGSWVIARGSDIQHLTMANNGTLYACARGLTYTLYRSVDDGVSWSSIGNVTDSIVDIAITPDDVNVIYYATTANVYRSTDSGKNFFQLGPSPGGAASGGVEITSIDVTRANSRLIAVGTRDTDSAQFGDVYILDEEQVIPGWTSTGLGGYDVYAVAFSPNYAGDRQLVAVVTDETNTVVTAKISNAGWGAVMGDARLNRDNSSVYSPVAVSNSAVIVFPDNYEGDADSEDCTLFVAIDTGNGSGDVYKIQGARAPGNSLAIDLNIGAAYGLNNIDVTGLAINGSGSAAKLLAGAASNSRIYVSADGGVNWTRSRKEPSGTSKTYVLMAPDFAMSSKAYATTSGTESAFSISQDKGLQWNQLALIDTMMSTIVDLAPSPDYSRDNTLFLLTFGGEHSLWRSTNGGVTWERVFGSALSNVDSLSLVALPPQYNSSNQKVFVAGVSNGNPAIWESTDSGQRFTLRRALDPDGLAITIDTWALVSDATLFIGSYDGSNGRVYRTTNSGFSYSSGVATGSLPLSSIVLSPGYEQDKTILVGNTNGWVYWSNNDGTSFEPLPPDATVAPLSGWLTVAFAPEFKSNNIVYAASSPANKGVYRFTIGKSSQWESIDGTLPSGGTLGQLKLLSEGTLWATNTKAGGGLERSLNPTFSLGPTFETVTRGLNDGVVLSGLWISDHRLWTVDATNTRLMTLVDSLTTPVKPISPADKASGVGTVINHTISNVGLEWTALSSATSYQWQIDHDTDFSSVPGGFEGNTQASSVRLPTLEPNTTYYWRVRANAPVLSPWSTRYSFTTSLDTEAVALKLESPTAGARGVPIKPIFQWSAVTGADAYELLVSTDVQFTNPIVVKINEYALRTTAWQCDVSLEYETTYYWKFRAVTANTRSAWSTVGAFITEPSLPKTVAPPQTPSIPTMPMPTVSIPLKSPTPTPVQLPPVIVTVPSAPSPPPPPPLPSSATPEWVIYLIGALFLTIILLLVIIMMLVVKIKRI